jgi:hypothetical protein
MADKLLLCISARQVTAAHWRAGAIAGCAVFENDEAGLEAFQEHLAEFSGVPVYVMADVVEEDYRFETLPHAFGSDRREMIHRKLRQHYRNSTYAAAVPLGRDDGKRRDDRYLFCALTNPDLIDGWMQAVAARGLPLAGVYLLPLVTAALIDELKLRSANLLVVSRQSGGLRLTFLQNGRFRLSRLTSIEGARGDATAAVVEEVSNTRIYLHALRAALLEDQLTVVLLDREDGLAAAAPDIMADNPGIDCVCLARRELASRLGVAETLLELSPDVLFLRLLARRTPAANLASAAATAGFRRHELRRALHAAAAGVALAAAAWSGVNLWQTADTRARHAELARQTAALQAQYREAASKFPEAPTTAENLMRAVEVAQRLQASARTPELLMAVVSKALDASPGIMVRELAWKYGVGEAASTRPGASAAPAAAPAPGAAARRTQSGYIEGEVRPFRGDYRAAIETIHAFAARLAGDSAVARVRVVKLPLNIDPALALSGNTFDSREQTGVADFAISVVLKQEL